MYNGLTGYDEWDGDAKAAFQLAAHQELIVAAQRVTQRHVQRSDVVTAGTDLKWMWNPETRGLGYAHYSARDLPGPVEQIERHGLVSAAGGALPAHRGRGADASS